MEREVSRGGIVGIRDDRSSRIVDVEREVSRGGIVVIIVGVIGVEGEKFFGWRCSCQWRWSVENAESI